VKFSLIRTSLLNHLSNQNQIFPAIKIFNAK